MCWIGIWLFNINFLLLLLWCSPLSPAEPFNIGEGGGWLCIRAQTDSMHKFTLLICDKNVWELNKVIVVVPVVVLLPLLTCSALSKGWWWSCIGKRVLRTCSLPLRSPLIQRYLGCRGRFYIARESCCVMDGALLMGCFVTPGSRHCPSLWAGTNGGTVYAFCLRVPPAERRMDEPVRAEQGKCLMKARFCWVWAITHRSYGQKSRVAQLVLFISDWSQVWQCLS